MYLTKQRNSSGFPHSDNQAAHPTLTKFLFSAFTMMSPS